MKHLTSSSFWEYFDLLPITVQELANKNYELLKKNPRHPSLHFKRINELWTVRIGQHYRAIGIEVKEGIQWIWIGSHEKYNQFFS